MPRHARKPQVPLLLAGLAVTFPVAPIAAQDLQAIRNQLRDDLSASNFTQSLLGLVVFADELELGSATYQIDDDVSTDVKTYALPFHTTSDLWGGERPRLYLEGALGYAVSRQGTDDLYGGLLPGLETSIDTKWRTYGGLLGVGLQFRPRPDLTVAPMLHLALSRIENETTFAGPGAATTAALTNGIAFNWDAWTIGYGGGVRADWQRPLGERHRLEVVGRYDLRWTDTFDADDSAQEFLDRTQTLTVRGDLIGPAGFDLFDKPVEWQLTSAYRAFLEGDLFGVDAYAQVGASLLVWTGDKSLPGTSGFAVGGSFLFGEDLTGWALGVRLLF
ncbi:MAG: hypothetical protein JNL12_03770 [Planctomycetes bacterium]|nr:hypothetical protein [Planctomycetota bacterium]